MIEITSLVKRYGNFTALSGVDLKVEGGLFGLLGPNGAGKTTLMRILATLIPPTSGQVKIGTIDVLQNPGEARAHLGYLPQEFGFYKGLNAYEILDYIGTMKNLSPAERRRQIPELLEQVNLTDAARRRAEGYSGGMKQRLGIAQALLGDPSLLIVDEPTAGLDPEERIRFRNLLARLARDRTILLSTHIVGDVEALCTGLAVMKGGRIAFCGTTEALAQQAEGQVWEVEIAPDEWETVTSQYPVIASRTEGRMTRVRLMAPESPLGRSVPVAATIEDGYMAVAGGEPGGR